MRFARTSDRSLFRSSRQRVIRSNSAAVCRSDHRRSSAGRRGVGASATASSARPETPASASAVTTGSLRRGRLDRSRSVAPGASVDGAPRARAEGRRSRAPCSPGCGDEARRAAAGSGQADSKASRTRTTPRSQRDGRTNLRLTARSRAGTELKHPTRVTRLGTGIDTTAVCNAATNP